MASLHNGQVGQSDSSRLTFRRKFWLIFVGLPVFVIVLLLLLALFLPRSSRALNPTEKALLGRWKVTGPHAGPRDYLSFEQEVAVSEPTSRDYRWEADEHSLYFRNNDIWSRFTNEKTEWQIEHLSDDELRVRYAGRGDPITMTYQRVK